MSAFHETVSSTYVDNGSTFRTRRLQALHKHGTRTRTIWIRKRLRNIETANEFACVVHGVHTARRWGCGGIRRHVVLRNDAGKVQKGRNDGRGGEFHDVCEVSFCRTRMVQTDGRLGIDEKVVERLKMVGRLVPLAGRPAEC